MNVTLDNTQRTTLRSVAVMALENRPLPNHWLEDGSLYHNLASAIQQLDHPDTDASLLDRLHRLASAIQQLDHPDTDASLLDRLHRAEARCAILESKWASVPWDDVRATIVCARHWTPHQENGLNFTEDHRMFDRLTAWVQASRPKDTLA